MTKLYIINGPIAGQSFDFIGETTSIGRAPDNDIQLDDRSISRRHVRIVRRDKTFFLEDLNSKNGTLIDGYPIKPGIELEVEEGIPIAIGDILISLGTKYSEDGTRPQYSINLLGQTDERGADLFSANTQLRQEISERQQAEGKLKEMHEQLKEANKNLGLAYAQMRDWKDRLSLQLHREEIGFLIDETGSILGFTERAIEITGRNRIDLLESNIVDLVDEGYRQELKNTIRNAWSGVARRIPFPMIGNQQDQKELEAKLMHISLENKKRLLILLRTSDKE